MGVISKLSISHNQISSNITQQLENHQCPVLISRFWYRAGTFRNTHLTTDLSLCSCESPACSDIDHCGHGAPGSAVVSTLGSNQLTLVVIVVVIGVCCWVCCWLLMVVDGCCSFLVITVVFFAVVVVSSATAQQMVSSIVWVFKGAVH